MTREKLHIIQKILSRTGWLALGVGTIVLLGAAMNKKATMICQKVEITITGAHNNIFIDEKDVENILLEVNHGTIAGKPIQSIDLAQMETVLQQNDWIKKAEVFFDNNEVMWVNIMEREPIARIFTQTGQSFYIDTSTLRIPLSEKFSARLPIFTGYNDSATTKADTMLLGDIKNMSSYILKDSFWMAQIDQVVITNNHTFEIVPKIGNQLILFGPADKYQEKFHNLFLFYKNVLSKVGWNKYSKISVEYAGQIISVKRGIQEVKMDSLKTAEIMKNILLKAQMTLLDSTGIQLSQRDDMGQQIIPLVNVDLPDENVSLLSKPKFNLAGNLKLPVEKKDTIRKAAVVKDSGILNVPKRNIRVEPKHNIKKQEAVKPLVKKTVKDKPKPVINQHDY